MVFDYFLGFAMNTLGVMEKNTVVHLAIQVSTLLKMTLVFNQFSHLLCFFLNDLFSLIFAVVAREMSVWS